MKVAAGNTAMAAMLLTNCIVAVAKDDGVTLPDAMQDQIQTILVTVLGLALTAFVQWAHHLMTTRKNAVITSLANSTVQAPNKPV